MTVTETLTETEIVPLRAAAVFAEITSVTLAGPVPEEAPETVIQLGRPATDHWQQPPVCMPMFKSPPPTGVCSEVGVRVYVQPGEPLPEPTMAWKM